jgi:hypothetical protein
MRSTSSYCFSFGSVIFSWSSKKQEVIAQSTAEVEYVAAIAAVNQAIWIRKLMTDLQMEQKKSTRILVDNQAAISIAKNLVFHGKMKHFKMKLYFLREGEIQLIYCKTENQNANILTKPLPKAKYEFLRQRLGIYIFRAKRRVELMSQEATDVEPADMDADKSFRFNKTLIDLKLSKSVKIVVTHFWVPTKYIYKNIYLAKGG